MRVTDFDRAIRSKIADLPFLAKRAADSWTVESLGGLTNRSFKLSAGGDSYVLRLPGPGTERYLDRAREAHNIGIAATAGLSPEIVHFDLSDGTMVTRFIEGAVTLDEDRLRDSSMLGAVVDTLKRLHCHARGFRGSMRLFPKLDEYLALSADLDHALLANLESARAKADVLRGPLEPATAAQVPCHIDPAPHNFMVARQPDGTNRIYLLDWEYSATCEPNWDLGVLSTEGAFDPDQDAAMIERYYGRVSTAQLGQLLSYKAALHLLAAAWMAVQLTAGNNDTANFQSLATERLERFREAMADPDLRSFLAAAAA